MSTAYLIDAALQRSSATSENATFAAEAGSVAASAAASIIAAMKREMSFFILHVLLMN